MSSTGERLVGPGPVSPRSGTVRPRSGRRVSSGIPPGEAPRSVDVRAWPTTWARRRGIHEVQTHGLLVLRRRLEGHHHCPLAPTDEHGLQTRAGARLASRTVTTFAGRPARPGVRRRLRCASGPGHGGDDDDEVETLAGDFQQMGERMGAAVDITDTVDLDRGEVGGDGTGGRTATSPIRAGGAPAWPKMTGHPVRQPDGRDPQRARRARRRRDSVHPVADGRWSDTVPAGRRPAMSEAGRTLPGATGGGEQALRGRPGPKPEGVDETAGGDWGGASPDRARSGRRPWAERGGALRPWRPCRWARAPPAGAAAATDPAEVSPIGRSSGVRVPTDPLGQTRLSDAGVEGEARSPPALSSTSIRAAIVDQRRERGQAGRPSRTVMQAASEASPWRPRSCCTARRGPRSCRGPR